MLVGAGVFIVGALVVIGELTQPTSDQADAIVGAIVFMVIGAVVFAPCLIFTIRGARGELVPVAAWSPARVATPVAGVTPDLGHAHPQWFGMPRSPVEHVSKVKLRTLTGVAAAVQPMLEPGEQVLVAVRGIERSPDAVAMTAAFGAVGQLVAAAQQSCYYLVFTDRRLFAFTSSQYERTPRYAKFSLPRAALTGITVRRAALFGRRLTVSWTGGRLRLQIPRRWRPEAEHAASLAPAAAPAGALP